MTTEARPPVAPGERRPTSRSRGESERDGIARGLSGPEPRAARPVHRAVVPLLPAQIAQMERPRASSRRSGRNALCRGHSAENARLYFKFRPTRMRLAAVRSRHTSCVRFAEARGDPGAGGEMGSIQSIHGDLPEPCPPRGRHGHREDGRLREHRDRPSGSWSSWPQLKGQFLIDRTASSAGRTSSAPRALRDREIPLRRGDPDRRAETAALTAYRSEVP